MRIEPHPQTQRGQPLSALPSAYRAYRASHASRTSRALFSIRISRLAFLFLFHIFLSSAFAVPRPVSFSYRPDRDVRSVHVAGSWNGWSKTAAPLERAGAGAPFVGTLELPEGRHFYKFVLDDVTFIADPRATERVPDGFGAFNSVITVGPVDTRPARLGDGVISEAFVVHKPEPRWIAHRPDGRVAVRLFVRAADVEAVSLVQASGATPCARVATDGDQDLFEVALDQAPSAYVFRLTDGSTTRFYGPAGLRARASAAGRFDAPAPIHAGGPEWIADAVFYQIFPDRFANGDRANDPPGTSPWGAKPTNTSWSGGDLEGVRQRLGYLRELGVNAIYFNPLFASESNHGYNTADYDHIATRFGGDAAFDRLAAELRKIGFRVILDGVFNHTGTAFFAFQDLITHGAASKYASWYRVASWPIVMGAKSNYECWWGFGSLPRLMVDTNTAVRDYLLDVVSRWTRTGIDGWRLDVPNEVDHPFWRAFRQTVRAANPQGYIIGEIWEDGSAWLQGDQFDGVMNYRFRRAMLEFLATGKADAGATAHLLDRIRMDYPPGTTHALFNLLGSHDTERFITLAGNEAWKQLAATTFLLASPGVPSIYYGDELGLEGGKDPDNRRTMPWERVPGNATLAHHKTWIAARRELGLGHYSEASYEALSPDVLAMRRAGPHGEQLVVILNRGAAPFALARPAPGVTWRALSGAVESAAPHTATVLLGR